MSTDSRYSGRTAVRIASAQQRVQYQSPLWRSRNCSAHISSGLRGIAPMVITPCLAETPDRSESLPALRLCSPCITDVAGAGDLRLVLCTQGLIGGHEQRHSHLLPRLDVNSSRQAL